MLFDFVYICLYSRGATARPTSRTSSSFSHDSAIVNKGAGFLKYQEYCSVIDFDLEIISFPYSDQLNYIIIQYL